MITSWSGSIPRTLKQALNLPNIASSCRFFSMDRSKDIVLIEKDGPLHIIGINRPEKRNCVNHQTALLLKQAFQSFSEDPSAKVAVLYGKGGTFCAGYDLKEVSTADVELSEEMGPMGPTRMHLKKPVIAAIDGYAVAGGLELALWCDIRVMEETAKLGVFCRRFGVPLIDGGTVRLPKLIGLSRAMELILTGRAVGGKEALEIGLVSQLCKQGEALKVAVDLAHTLCEYPQECMLADRESAYKNAFEGKSLEESLQFEYENSKPVLVKAVLGASKFVEGVGRHGSKL